jgi:polyisoprenoid-binding protein YceI
MRRRIKLWCMGAAAGTAVASRAGPTNASASELSPAWRPPMSLCRSSVLASTLLIAATAWGAAAPTVDHFGTSTWYGDFTHVSGTLKLDPKNPAASHVEVSAPTASLSTTNTDLDGTLKGADWFDVAKFPTMTFKSTKVTATGPGRASIEGELDLHGVTRPLTLEARFKGAAGPNAILKAYEIGFDLTGSLKRSDFGISRYAATIGDEVHLIISAPFERKGD